jgi:flagellar motor switch protein FliM
VEREATEIENHVMEGVGKIICHEIAAAWSMNASDCDLIGAQGIPQLQRLLPANDRVVLSQFEIKMAESTGQLRILTPAISFNTLLRKLSSDVGKAIRPTPSGSKLREKLLECCFPVALGITAIQLPIDKVLELSPDQICNLGVPVNQPATLMIAGRDSFDAIPVRQGRRRAAQIGQPRTHSTEKRTGQ